MELHAWLAFVGASAILLVFPGPTVMLVTGFGMAHGARRACWAALGVALGDVVSLSCSLAGLGVFLQTSAALFTTLKLAGAAYMLWLGFKMLRSKHGDEATGGRACAASTGSRRMVAQAFAVTALNPKSILFFVAFVPQFISPQAAPLPQMAIILATFVLLALLNSLAYIYLASRMRRAAASPRAVRYFSRAGGATLVGAGIWTAVREAQ